MICVEIDELVPCLIDNETGEVVEQILGAHSPSSAEQVAG